MGSASVASLLRAGPAACCIGDVPPCFAAATASSSLAPKAGSSSSRLRLRRAGWLATVAAASAARRCWLATVAAASAARRCWLDVPAVCGEVLASSCTTCVCTACAGLGNAPASFAARTAAAASGSAAVASVGIACAGLCNALALSAALTAAAASGSAAVAALPVRPFFFAKRCRTASFAGLALTLLRSAPAPVPLPSTPVSSTSIGSGLTSKSSLLLSADVRLPPPAAGRRLRVGLAALEAAARLRFGVPTTLATTWRTAVCALTSGHGKLSNHFARAFASSF